MRVARSWKESTEMLAGAVLNKRQMQTGRQLNIILFFMFYLFICYNTLQLLYQFYFKLL